MQKSSWASVALSRADPGAAREALSALARAMNAYLAHQIDAGADAVQLFDTWSGLLDVAELPDLRRQSRPSDARWPGSSHDLLCTGRRTHAEHASLYRF